jgi:PKD repeat protein
MGPGNANTNDMASEPDVTYHEFGHGVTDVTSGLAYRHESGGLNEAASDVYAAMVEAWINTVPGGAANANTPIAYAPNADSWTIGEGLRRDGLPFRRMGNPASRGGLDRYSQYVAQFGNCVNPSTTANDNCGVHTSSGIANLAFYLLVNGGRHPANATNIQVAPISFARAARYFFEVNQLRAVNANATFSQFRNAMQARARANADGGLCDEVSISQAWAAVEVDGNAPQNPNACNGAANQSPTAAFTATPNGLTVAFNGAGSSDPDGAIASYSWNFGDGSTANGVNVNRTYASAGTYTVALTVTDNQGATNTRTQQVTVTAPNSQCPGAAFAGSFSGASGQSQYQPTGGSYTTTVRGTHTICINGPAGTDYDVYLQRRSATGTWSNVASGETSSAAERISFVGAAGTYRVRVTNYRGTGAYTGSLQKP